MSTRAQLPQSSRSEAVLLGPRWKTLLGKAPPLQPLVAELLGRRWQSLPSGLDPAAAEQLIQSDAARWLAQFEALPQFAVAAIGTLLVEESWRRSPEPEPQAAAEGDLSPEHSLGKLETLLSDPAFALAFYCIETRLSPWLNHALSPAVAQVPREVWLGLLHAGSPQPPVLTPDVAVALVLRVRSLGWARLPARVRQAAMRLAFASAADLQASSTLERLCADLPSAWRQSAGTAKQFAAAVAGAREHLAEAVALCARVVAATRARAGGLAALSDGGAPPASSSELSELARSARQFSQIPGIARLLELL